MNVCVVSQNSFTKKEIIFEQVLKFVPYIFMPNCIALTYLINYLFRVLSIF